MEAIPKDLGRRIVAAARLAVLLHVEKMAFDGVEATAGGAGRAGGAPEAPLPAGYPARRNAESEAA
jgi:hypothetical protein